MITHAEKVKEFQVSLGRVHNGCLWASRGMGKSYGLALIAANSEYKNIAVTSAGFRQSKLVGKYIEDLLIEEDNHLNTSTRSSVQIIRTKDGRTIECVPISQLAGRVPDLLLVDEFQSIPMDQWHIIVNHGNWKACANKS